MTTKDGTNSLKREIENGRWSRISDFSQNVIKMKSDPSNKYDQVLKIEFSGIDLLN
jgi:hypothetical protein